MPSTIQQDNIPTRVGETVESVHGMGTLTVVAGGWSKLCVDTFGEAAIFAHEIVFSHWSATSDGRGLSAEFAGFGEDTGEEVFYERQDGTHGWVDSISRKIVQAG